MIQNQRKKYVYISNPQENSILALLDRLLNNSNMFKEIDYEMEIFSR